MANLRRDSARRSYRSMACICFVSCDRIVANFCGPCGVEVRNFAKAAIGMSGAFGRRSLRMTATFIRCDCSRLIGRIAQCTGQELMARVTHAAQIDLRFGDPACEHLDVSAGVRPRDLTCEGLHLFRQALGRTGRAGSTRGGMHFSPSGRGRDEVFGPVLARAFARLALILRSLVKPRFFLWLASSRSLQTRRPRPLARSVAVFRRAPPDADRSRAGWRCGGSRRWW